MQTSDRVALPFYVNAGFLYSKVYLEHSVKAQLSKRKRALLGQVGVKRNRNSYGNTNWGLNGWYNKEFCELPWEIVIKRSAPHPQLLITLP